MIEQSELILIINTLPLIFFIICYIIIVIFVWLLSHTPVLDWIFDKKEENPFLFRFIIPTIVPIIISIVIAHYTVIYFNETNDFLIKVIKFIYNISL